MKKSLFFVAAASALMLTACSRENDVLQTATPTQQTAVQEQAVGFDMFTTAATNSRRAGYAGVMTTDKLKTNTDDNKIGFGVMAIYQNDNTPYSSGDFTPNFMFNEHVTWVGGWTYSPLKYWPNETAQDSQTTPATSTATDKLSFFAYAPYVSTGSTGTLSTKGNIAMDIQQDGYNYNNPTSYYKTETSGIMAISSEDYKNDPLVQWGVSSNPDNNVDLLWGVAPEGLSYTAVNGSTINTTPGKPIVDMVKPNKDQKIKFLFEHALSRIGLTVVSAIDQVADGGNLDANTRILIDEVLIYGTFGTQGVLNLNNTTPHQANWIETSVNRTESTESAPLFTINTTNKYLTPSLRYDAAKIAEITGTVGTAGDGNASKFAELNDGVLTKEQPLMVGGPDPSKKVTNPAFVQDKIFYTNDDGDYVMATTKASDACDAYVQEGTFNTEGNKFTCKFKTDGSTKVPMSGTTPVYYKLPLVNKVVSSENPINNGDFYYERTGSGTPADPYVFTCKKSTSNKTSNVADKYWVKNVDTPVQITASDYSGDCYTGLLPRYFMVIPSPVDPAVATTINVKITYHVVTKDTKLTDNITDVTNAITKTVPVTLVNGKSYNLKLILGLTSVKLDATVKDWEVADETEVNLPQNND